MTKTRKSAHKASSHHGFFFYLVSFLLVLIVLAGVGLFVVAPRLLDTHRAEIATALSNTLGRKVDIGGPLGLSLSWRNGVDLSVDKVSIDNPSWASRPVFAKIDRLALGVGIAPLLDHVIEVSGFSVSGADILLETAKDGRTNWDFSNVKTETKAGKAQSPSTAPAPATPSSEARAAQPFTVRLSAKGIVISDSQIGIRGADGSLSKFSAEKLSILPRGSDQTEMHFVGTLANFPVKMDATTGALEKVMTSDWPVQADVAVAGLTLSIKGVVREAGKEIILQNYQITRGSTQLGGKFLVDLHGSKPNISGTVSGKKLVLSDLKLETPEAARAAQAGNAKKAPSAPKEAVSPADKGRLFSSEVLPLEALRSVNAVVSVDIGQVDMGTSSIEDLKTQISLKDGALVVSPLQMHIGGALAQGTLQLNAGRVPAALQLLFKADKVDLTTLAKLGGAESFINGKGNLNINLNATGNSPHALVSSLDGQLNLLVSGGTLYGKTLAAIGGSLSALIGSGSSNPALNCMAARYAFQNGQMRSNGVVIDSDLATIEGTGGIDFREERINMLFSPEGKGKGLGDLTPPVRITGTLVSPQYGVDTSASVTKVAGLLSQGLSIFKKQGASQEEKVNACATFVQNPNKNNASPSATGNVGEILKGTGSVGQKIQGVGDQLMKNLGNGLLKGF